MADVVSQVSPKYDDTSVKIMVYPAIAFMVIGMFFGTFISYNAYIFPDYFSGEYLHFGRLRPVHVSHVLLLWLLSADIGLSYFMTQRLCGVPLWSSRMAVVSAALWWFTLIVGVYSFAFGTNSGWEYAELPMWLGWLPIKIMATVALGLVAINLWMTVINRKYEKLYVSLWYIMGTMIWAVVTFIVGNFVIEGVPGGISRVNVNFFYVHNLVGLVFTPMGLATAYYFLPKLTNTPIYSHRLSMIGFWSIAFVYAWVGAHHIIHGPMSQWLQTVAIIFSIWLFVPVWTVVANLFATMKGVWHKYSQSVPVRFLLMGNLFYLMVSTQGSFMALRNVNEITSKTDWVIAHAHLSLLGTFTFFAIAGIYAILPILTKRPLWSDRLAEWHWTLTFLGAMMMYFALHLAGFLQGLQWASWANGNSYHTFHNNLSKLPFLQTVANMHYWWVLRSLSGLTLLIGNLLFLVNVYNTVVLRPPAGTRRPQTIAVKVDS